MNHTAQLTDRQREVLDFIRDKIRSRGYGPTIREIMQEFDINGPNGVTCHLKALEKKGVIKRDYGRSRAITIVEADDMVQVKRADLEALIAACKAHIAKGHNDTCQSQLISEYPCNCGHDLAVAAVARIEGNQ